MARDEDGTPLPSAVERSILTLIVGAPEAARGRSAAPQGSIGDPVVLADVRLKPRTGGITAALAVGQDGCIGTGAGRRARCKLNVA